MSGVASGFFLGYPPQPRTAPPRPVECEAIPPGKKNATRPSFQLEGFRAVGTHFSPARNASALRYGFIPQPVVPANPCLRDFFLCSCLPDSTHPPFKTSATTTHCPPRARNFLQSKIRNPKSKIPFDALQFFSACPTHRAGFLFALITRSPGLSISTKHPNIHPNSFPS